MPTAKALQDKRREARHKQVRGTARHKQERLCLADSSALPSLCLHQSHVYLQAIYDLLVSINQPPFGLHASKEADRPLSDLWTTPAAETSCQATEKARMAAYHKQGLWYPTQQRFQQHPGSTIPRAVRCWRLLKSHGVVVKLTCTCCGLCTAIRTQVSSNDQQPMAVDWSQMPPSCDPVALLDNNQNTIRKKGMPIDQQVWVQ